MTREQRARAFASHLALLTFTLFERYGERRKVGGPYRTVAALERAVERQLQRMDRANR
jgi:hypothetical protein